MRMRIAVVAVVAVLAPPAIAQERPDCGGDNPHWLLLTLVGIREFPGGAETVDRSILAPLFIKTCDIADVGVIAGPGDTLITVIQRYSSPEAPNERRAMRSYWQVAESITEICEAMPTCSDARTVKW